jgi:hypothetical protein
VYEPLPTHGEPTIRLLKIAGRKTGKARITVEHSTLKEAQRRRYETLSYVWGTTDRSTTIALHDDTLLRVTPTLEAALPHIIQTSVTEYIWIDQICINQDDVEEKTHQVVIMGQIYSMCFCVLVWLGTSTKRDLRIRPVDTSMPNLANSRRLPHDMAMNMALPPKSKLIIPEYGFRARKSTNVDISLNGFVDHSRASPFPRSARQPVETRMSNLAGSRRLPYDMVMDMAMSERVQRADALAEVLDSEYFSRAWVFQEIVLPPKSKLIIPEFDVRARKSTNVDISLKDFIDHLRASPFPRSARHPITKADTRMINLMYTRWEQQHTTSAPVPPIEHMLSSLTPHAKTSFKLDRLYAFFGLHGEDFDLSPKYGISFKLALIATAKAIIVGSSRLDILEYVIRDFSHREPNPSLPAWAPDFRHPECVAPYRRSASPLAHGGENYMLPWSGAFDGDLLHVRGRIIDTVGVKFAAHASDDVARENRIVNLVTHLDAKLRIEEQYGGSDATSSAQNAPGSSRKARRKAKRDVSANRDGADSTTTPITARVKAALNAEGCCSGGTRDAMDNRELWYTEHERLAAGTHFKKGDSICILQGASNPVCLRPCEEPGRWVVMGTCYLEGWMNPWGRGKVDWEENENVEFVLV